MGTQNIGEFRLTCLNWFRFALQSRSLAKSPATLEIQSWAQTSVTSAFRKFRAAPECPKLGWIIAIYVTLEQKEFVPVFSAWFATVEFAQFLSW